MKEARKRHYLSISFISLLLCSSCDSPGHPKLTVNEPVKRVDVEIVLDNGDSTVFDVELGPNGKGSRSFKKNLGHNDDYAVSVSYSYAGHVRLSNPFRDSDVKDGHVITFRLFRLDPKTDEALDSKLVYGFFTGRDTIVTRDFGMKILMHSAAPQ